MPSRIRTRPLGSRPTGEQPDCGSGSPVTPSSRLRPRDQRLMFLVTGAIVFVDTMFYAAVAPLLPVLTHQLRLSKASAGVLTASYAVGMLVGAIPAGAIAERFGPRVATYTGLALLGTSSLAFGVLDAVPCSTPPASPRASAAPARGRASSPG